ncbi:PfkB family carbohydrate kinase [Alkaliphilus hydrothermalis]|uniref:Pseudouridine kinase n=1 Tax=Alkaliphilus hydrothermalis TaxID=1482730 RepID=A0ABS2NSF9_9FIRM|nr:PfkB family carbohydrate kinase [Alkaliphilus hydrothermalis]MBM7615707.1 pseudouridine kinase [Alkaliphilus hydrothermalis]
MTSREKEILEIIKKNPMIPQQEIADLLNINRSSVAVHIANLMKKGYIQGKGYIVREEKMVSVLGGSNIDLQGFPNDKLILMDSNPGKIETSLGGVGRNIAENLARLSVPVRLLSAVGEDFYGGKLIEEGTSIGIDMKNILCSKEYPTSMYLSIMDEDHDMKVAISQMEIYEKIDIGFIEENQLLIKNSSALVIDNNIPKTTIDYACGMFKEIPIFCDPVSTAKAMRVKDSLDKIHTLKPNTYEAAKLLDMEINTLDDVRKAGELLLKKGVKQLFISMGKEGVFACDGNKELVVKGQPKEIKGATGAGDAFMAGLVDCYLKDKTLNETTVYATAASYVALSSYSTINPLMTEEEIQRIINTVTIDVKEY